MPPKKRPDIPNPVTLGGDHAARALAAAHQAQRAIAPGPGRCMSCDAEVWRLKRRGEGVNDPDRIVMFDEQGVGEGSWTIDKTEGYADYAGRGDGYMTPHSC